MTLQVPFEDFASTAKRFQVSDAYMRHENALVAVSACNPQLQVTIVSQSSKTTVEVKNSLEAHQISVYKGIWSEDSFSLETLECEMFVAAVSYQSGEAVPGVWVDAFHQEPSHVQVLHALYEEFKVTGEMPDITIEEFVKTAKPNVVVVSDSELRGYVDAKQASSSNAR